MAEALTFANYRIDQDGLDGIYKIGADQEHPTGVIPEMAAAFGYELGPTPSIDNLGDLIGRVGPAKELQENIGLVQEALGTDEDAVTIARGWAERSGLLLPVQRYYATAGSAEEPIDLAIITGGVRNWMRRRASRLIKLDNEVGVGRALLVAGNRLMKTAEGEDVKEGMTEADYMGEVIMRKVEADGRGMAATLVAVDSDGGDRVMQRGVAEIIKQDLVDLGSERLAVVSNAGAWVQNAGQFKRAIGSVLTSSFAFDRRSDQLVAVSDGFPLGTGAEPTATHQNPFTAAGQIARNAQELARHAA